MLIGSLLTALALIPSMGALKAQEQITLVAAAEQNQWKITVEADTEVWADWNGNGQKDDNELLTSGQLAEQTTAATTLTIYGAVKKLTAPNNNIQELLRSSRLTCLTTISRRLMRLSVRASPWST